MAAPTVAKACVVPVCGSTKFNLVHKFPADKVRFEEWIVAIQTSGTITKLTNLTPEAIRKRFFVCARHFGLNEYKHAESRSLNLTAVPSMNLCSLSDIASSKAGHLQNNAEVLEEPSPEKVKPKPSNQIRILNSLAAKITLPDEEAQFNQITLPFASQSNDEEIQLHDVEFSPEPPPKRAKKTETKVKNQPTRVLNTLSSDVSPKKASPAKVQETQRKVTPRKKDALKPANLVEELALEKSEEVKPMNKLLALIEVTPEQYEKLSKSLTSAEKSENIESLINFIDKDDTDPSSADNEIDVKLQDGTELRVDLLWLRDHCRCDSCYDHSNHQRKINILDIPDDVSAENYAVKENKLQVLWNDNHESDYDLKFLVDNQPDRISSTSEISLWNKEKLDDPLKSSCRVAMRDYMSDPDVAKKVLESLHLYGVAFIDGVQPTQQNTEFVIRQLFPIHKTLFGEMWTFSDAKKDHSDTAYTNIYLGPHNDNTYFNDAAGLQILHCIQHACTGGENFLVDGFHVATKIKDEHPEVFKRLTETIVTGEYIEEGRHHKYSSPMINLDPITAKILQVRFNLADRAPFNTAALGKVRQFYGDLKIFAREFENPENRITFKLQPGTVMIFDNWRVLHGRLSYTGKRTMTGCYVARTEFESALRVHNFIE